VLKASAVGGSLLLGFHLPAPARAGSAGTVAANDFAPNAFIRINHSGRVTLLMSKVEMGQGTYTSFAMLVAEELEVSLNQVDLEPAPVDEALYGEQMTGGSTSIRWAWEPLRQAGATARTLLVAAAAQIWSVEAASCRADNGQVVHIPTGRTLAYGALVDRAATLSRPEHVPLKKPEEFKLVGTTPKRLDAATKISGKAQYGIDVVIPGMKIAAVVACPVFGGKLEKVDDSRARTIKGVRQVVRLDDAVAVIADHMWAARKGIAALDVGWDEGANAKLSTAEIVQQLEAAARKTGVIARQDGDSIRAMTGATTRVEAVYEVPLLAHATMEPMNCTVHISKGACDVWLGTQVPTRVKSAAAQAARLPTTNIRVHNRLIGGGFGRRLEIDYVTQAVLIAKEVDGPVKVVWTREEDIQHDMYRPYYYDRISAGLDDEGKPIAWNHRIVGSSVTARFFPTTLSQRILRVAAALLRPRNWARLRNVIGELDFDAVSGATDLPYDLPTILVDYVRQEPAGIPTAYWRGVGATHNVFVVESFIDELAAVAKKDPLEYRRMLLGKSPRARTVLELAAAKASWSQSLPVGSGRGISVQKAFGSYLAQVVEVEASNDGQVNIQRVVCAVDCGINVNPDTIRAQIEGGIIFGLTAALFGEITIKNGRVEQSNFHDYRILRSSEVPPIEVYLVNSREAPGGIGEAGTAAIAPALTNAIFAATGRRLRKLPINRNQFNLATDQWEGRQVQSGRPSNDHCD
jgi:isoquinoline 1-oxidoreductase beta subunit